MPSFRMIETNGINVRAAIEGSGPLVVFVHGFPESWYSWRHQLAPVAQAGFTACAIDVRGYGGSDKPHAIEAYDMETLTKDVAGVIAALSPNGKAVVVGHDWGAPIAWNTALLFPERVRAVAGLSVPYVPQGEVSLLDLAEAVFTKNGRFFYQVYFQAEGVAEAELEADVRDGLRRFYYAICGEAPDNTWPPDKKHGDALLHRLPNPDPFPAWLTKADEDYFVGEFERSGFRGPLNRYRNHRRDHAFLSPFRTRTIDQPALFIGGERDLVLKMFPGVDIVAMMKPMVPDLRGAHILPGVGHWTQQEAPAAVNALLVEWLKDL
ncbi:MAG: alpha/beta hydrolase [Hydrogenophilaceae bacterium]|jgi:pimeloyl-ACP methyl ester carboxylesterase|nr:alpha/beta hydrolase [Hydrogenophilaceae bacterium]